LKSRGTVSLLKFCIFRFFAAPYSLPDRKDVIE
jgi:hypothetical protein